MNNNIMRSKALLVKELMDLVFHFILSKMRLDIMYMIIVAQ